MKNIIIVVLFSLASCIDASDITCDHQIRYKVSCNVCDFEYGDAIQNKTFLHHGDTLIKFNTRSTQAHYRVYALFGGTNIEMIVNGRTVNQNSFIEVGEDTHTVNLDCF